MLLWGGNSFLKPCSQSSFRWWNHFRLHSSTYADPLSPRWYCQFSSWDNLIYIWWITGEGVGEKWLMSCLYEVFGDISPALTFSCISKLLLSDLVYHGGIYWGKKKRKIIYIYIKASTYLYVSFYLTCSQSMKDKFHVKWKLNLCYNLYVLLCLRRTGYVKVFQQSVVYFSWGKQRWLHVFAITSHVTTVCLSCHTVIIPHKQDRYHCTDTTPFFFTIIAAFFYLM